jgi:uroporphyrinogen decarboxylase
VTATVKPGLTAHERYVRTLTFGGPDRAFFFPGVPRESTLAAWRTQGLPGGADYRDVLCDETGIPREALAGYVDPGVNVVMLPEFEERILEHSGGHYVVQDWKGNVVEISDEFDARHLRAAIDFVTRRWIKLPVESREDFEEMKRRYDPEDPARFPRDFDQRCRQLRENDCVVRICVRGPFDQLREWVGFERLCVLFIEDPDFVREMVSFWTDFLSRVMRRLLDSGVLDVIYVNEDMAYKEKAMISPAMTRAFLKPAYDRWVPEFRAAGVPVLVMDSDGKLDELIPIWLESGFNVCYPVEVAAGCDINEYRRRYGDRLGFIGGIDKRAIARGGRVIEDELERVRPVIEGGGCVPGCDHGVPPDISWPDFVRYVRMLAGMTGWL